LADGGTIFLDELTEVPMALQAELLRVLQEYSIDRLGGNRVINLDLRVIAALAQAGYR
jgi:two-component system response regulator AtoC